MRVNLRELAKAAARGMAKVLVAPLVISFVIRRALLGADRSLLASTQWLALIPGLPGQYLRRAFLAFAIAGCDRSATVEWGTTFSRAGARLGRNVYIGPNCDLGLVDVEDDALIAAAVHIPSGGMTHGIDDPTIPIREQPGREQMVRIGAGAWIGSCAVVLANIGDGSVVGAGSVVTRALPAGVVAAGAPARIVRQRANAAEAV
jgi:acetyltransferase-like isoleucine patch superfamily enzyme